MSGSRDAEHTHRCKSAFAGLLAGTLRLPAKHGAEVRAEGLTNSLHMNFVRERVAIDDEVSRQPNNIFRRRTRHEPMRAKGDARTFHATHLDLGNAVRMGADDLDGSARPWSPEGEFHMRWDTVVAAHEPGSLAISQVRLADVPELQLLLVRERVDSGVLADSGPSPLAEEETKRLEFRQRDAHGATVKRDPAITPRV
jgi:hypothetical protein